MFLLSVLHFQNQGTSSNVYSIVSEHVIYHKFESINSAVNSTFQFEKKHHSLVLIKSAKFSKMKIYIIFLKNEELCHANLYHIDGYFIELTH